MPRMVLLIVSDRKQLTGRYISNTKGTDDVQFLVDALLVETTLRVVEPSYGEVSQPTEDQVVASREILN